MVVEECGLSDMGYKGSKFTWSNNRESQCFTKERLNRAFSTKYLTDFCTGSMVSTLASLSSDHCPPVINVSASRMDGVKTVRPFLYELSWDLREECKKLINDSWSYSSGP